MADIEKGDDMRADMAKAIDAVEQADTKEPDYVEQASEPTESAPEETQAEVPPQEAQPPASEVAAEVERSRPPGKEPKPPVDWTPDLKQHWKNLPAEVRQAVASRERDVSVMLQQTTAERKMAQDFVRTVEPFRALMAAEGVQNPIQAVEGLMRVTATLAMGSPQQKAERIAGLVKHYGIDIEMLDQALVGTLPQANPQQTQLEQMLEQRMAPVNQLLAQVNQANQQQHDQLYTNAYQSIEQFGADPKNEFFDDVRIDMADFLEMAAQRNQPLTLQDAYNRACALHPQISQITAKRGNGMLSKRNAASSISGSGGARVATGGDVSLRDTIAAAFEDGDRI